MGHDVVLVVVNDIDAVAVYDGVTVIDVSVALLLEPTTFLLLYSAAEVGVIPKVALLLLLLL